MQILTDGQLRQAAAGIMDSLHPLDRVQFVAICDRHLANESVLQEAEKAFDELETEHSKLTNAHEELEEEHEELQQDRNKLAEENKEWRDENERLERSLRELKSMQSAPKPTKRKTPVKKKR